MHNSVHMVVSVAQLVARRTNNRKVVGLIPTNAVSTVSEPSEMKPNLVDRTCELLK